MDLPCINNVQHPYDFYCVSSRAIFIFVGDRIIFTTPLSPDEEEEMIILPHFFIARGINDLRNASLPIPAFIPGVPTNARLRKEWDGAGPNHAAADPGTSGQKKMMKKGLRGRGKCVFSKPPIFRFFFLQRARGLGACSLPPLLPICTQARTAVQTGKQGGKGAGEGYKFLKSEAAAAAACIPVREKKKKFS